MPYQPYTNNKPSLADTGAQVVDHTRWNLEALRDAVLSGVLPGWNLTGVIGFSETPRLLWSNGTLRLKATLTWGTIGNNIGALTTVLFEFSTDSGTTYATLLPYSTLTFTYGGSGTLAAPGYCRLENWS